MLTNGKKWEHPTIPAMYTIKYKNLVSLLVHGLSLVLLCIFPLACGVVGLFCIEKRTISNGFTLYRIKTNCIVLYSLRYCTGTGTKAGEGAEIVSNLVQHHCIARKYVALSCTQIQEDAESLEFRALQGYRFTA